jgi:hypothetical protein
MPANRRHPYVPRMLAVNPSTRRRPRPAALGLGLTILSTVTFAWLGVVAVCTPWKNQHVPSERNDMTTILDDSSLVQRIDDAELPAVGQWHLHRVSYVGISSGRERLPLSVSDGVLTVTDPPLGSTLSINALCGERWVPHRVDRGDPL